MKVHLNCMKICKSWDFFLKSSMLMPNEELNIYLMRGISWMESQLERGRYEILTFLIRFLCMDHRWERNKNWSWKEVGRTVVSCSQVRYAEKNHPFIQHFLFFSAIKLDVTKIGTSYWSHQPFSVFRSFFSVHFFFYYDLQQCVVLPRPTSEPRKKKSSTIITSDEAHAIPATTRLEKYNAIIYGARFIE